MSICQLCKAIDLSKIIENYRFSHSPKQRSQLPIGWVHYTKYSDLRSSAANCRSCALFYQESNADERYPNKPTIKDDDRVQLFALTGDRWPRKYRMKNNAGDGIFLVSLNVEVGAKMENNISYYKYLDIWIEDGEDSPLVLQSKVLLRAAGTIRSTDDMSMVRKWLTICTSTHQSCKLKSRGLDDLLGGENVILPTRVIDVGHSDGTQEPLLLETNGLRGTYLTLSHCWGNSIVTRTTHSTLNTHKTCIPLADLCPNFRDAILVTRRLEFRYLWIDSLCIIQDSAEDWDLESSRMAQVYNNSTLTLSPAVAANSDEGFLKSRNPLEDISAKIPYHGSTGAVDGHFYICEPLSDFDKDAEQGPLNKRGWTLQERVLSRRNVFFGKDQLHWECQSARWSENSGLNDQEFTSSITSTSLIRGLLSLSVHDPANDLKLWYMVVGEFTKRALTNGNDKLPALSGIVNVFNQALSNEGKSSSYVVGLWKQDIARGLLWKSFGRSLEQQLKVRVPSWSWISHDGRIEFGDESASSIVAITDMEFDIKLAGPDPFGRVHGGEISFVGFIRAVPSVSRTGPDFQDRDGKQLYVYTNALLKDEDRMVIGGAYLDQPNAELEGAMHCVPIRYSGTGRALKIEAILLREVVGKVLAYQRVGVAELGGKSAKESSFGAPFQSFLASAEKRRITVI